LAWDLFLFRWCETLCTQMKGNNFYVPVVTTLDGKLLDAVRSCPLRALLIHDSGGLVEALFDDELVFSGVSQQFHFRSHTAENQGSGASLQDA